MSFLMLSPSQMSFLMLSPSQMSFLMLSPSQMSFLMLSPSQMSFLMLSPSQMSFLMLSPSQMSFLMLSPSQMSFLMLSPSQMSFLMLSPSQMSFLMLSPSQTPLSPFEPDEPSRVHNVMVRVVVVDPDWHSFEVRGGWPDAVGVRESESLKYFEVAIWEDVGAIHFYAIDNDFDVYGSDAAEVTAERESYTIQRNTGLPAPWTDERSTFIRQAFASFTSDLVTRYPESAHHLMYSGHGGPGGALFAGQLFYEDASGILAHWTNELGSRLGVIDMGGPCNKGSFSDVENFCKYSHYYVASDLPNGGYTFDDWTFEKYQETDPESQYHRLFADSSNLRDVVVSRIDLRQRSYDYSRNNMINSKTEQGNYLYSCKGFLDFGPAFRAFLTSADHDYDVFDDLYSFMIRHDASEGLLRAFDDVIVYQADNRDFFEWEEDSSGMLMPLD